MTNTGLLDNNIPNAENYVKGQNKIAPSQSPLVTALTEGEPRVNNAQEAVQTAERGTQVPTEAAKSGEGAENQTLAGQETDHLKRTLINTDPARHTPEEQQGIAEYVNSADDGLLDFANRYIEEPNAKFGRYTISNVNERQAQELQRKTGLDFAGYTNAINSDGIKHIVKRHGANGEQDSTMAESADIARIGYVLKNFDDVERLVDEQGQPILAKGFNGANDTSAPMVRYGKKIDGNYYVVEAVADNAHKKLWVVSAYMDKNNSGVVTQVFNAANATPHATPEATLVSPNSAVTSNIPNAEDYVKGQNKIAPSQSPLATALPEGEPSTRQNNTAEMPGIELVSEERRADFAKAAEVAERFGAYLEIAVLENADGKYENGVITINPNTERPVARVLIHELTHYLEESGGYAELIGYINKYVRKHLGWNGKDVDGWRLRIAEAYARRGVQLDEQGIDKECAAIFCEEKLFNEKDAAAINRLAVDSPGLFARIKAWIREASLRLRGAKAQADIARLERLYNNAAASARRQRGENVRLRSTEQERTEQGGENAQYSIRIGADGRPFVEVENDILADTDGRSIARTLSDIIRNKFHNLIEANGQKIGINTKTTLREWRYSKEASALYNNNRKVYNDKIKVYNDKIRAFDNADELLTAAREWTGEEAKHKNYDEFARGRVDFRVGENGYAADVVVGINRTGGRAYLYDIVNIKRKNIEGVPQANSGYAVSGENRISRSDTPSSSASITNPAENVKINLQENSERGILNLKASNNEYGLVIYPK